MVREKHKGFLMSIKTSLWLTHTRLGLMVLLASHIAQVKQAIKDEGWGNIIG